MGWSRIVAKSEFYHKLSLRWWCPECISLYSSPYSLSYFYLEHGLSSLSPWVIKNYRYPCWAWAKLKGAIKIWFDIDHPGGKITACARKHVHACIEVVANAFFMQTRFHANAFAAHCCIAKTICLHQSIEISTGSILHKLSQRLPCTLITHVARGPSAANGRG